MKNINLSQNKLDYFKLLEMLPEPKTVKHARQQVIYRGKSYAMDTYKDISEKITVNTQLNNYDKRSVDRIELIYVHDEVGSFNFSVTRFGYPGYEELISIAKESHYYDEIMADIDKYNGEKFYLSPDVDAYKIIYYQGGNLVYTKTIISMYSLIGSKNIDS